MTNIAIDDVQKRKKASPQQKNTLFAKEKKSAPLSSFERLAKNAKISLEYLNKSKDGKRKVYKYTLPTSNDFFAPKDLMQFIRISKIFL